MIQAINEFLYNRYEAHEYPALAYQLKKWQTLRPLAGVKILDGTPVFANTLLKYINLLAAGADLTVGWSDAIPYDPAIIEFLQKIGVKCEHNCCRNDFFDVILDCNAVYRALRPQLGFAELTRSGAYHFAGTTAHVVNVDDSRIKAIETCMGTGESFLRAMNFLNYDVAGKNIVVMGCGKVGRGVVFYAGRAGARVIAVDDPQAVEKCIGGSLISRFDRPAVLDALRNAWCVVSATGQALALADEEYIRILLAGEKIIVNMGVEDEWGPAVPPDRVLNGKEPLNFILDEPTLLRYIDPTMALHNYAAVQLMQGGTVPGIGKVDPAEHDLYWQAVEKNGIISDELSAAGL